MTEALMMPTKGASSDCLEYTPTTSENDWRYTPMSLDLNNDLEQTLHGLLSMDQSSFVSHADPRIGVFLGYWAELAMAKGGFPGRGDLDPTRMNPSILPNLFIVDVLKSENGQYRYRYRLLGSMIVEFEMASRGKHLDEITNRNVTAIEQHYEAAVRGSIYLRRSSLSWLSEALSPQSYSVVVLPLSDDGKAPTHLFGLCLYDGY